MVEQIGSGIGRMKQEIKNAGFPAPSFRTDGMFTVVFYREKSSGKSSEAGWKEIRLKLSERKEIKLGKSALKIIEMIYEKQNVTIPQMARKLGITNRAVEKNLKKLKE